ncbi:MAG: phosphoenolpyruvate carboxylase [Rickettsiales bacterium]|nr:phosphoenolpyruvate carboxylase [Rickettsiales bacterium]
MTSPITLQIETINYHFINYYTDSLEDKKVAKILKEIFARQKGKEGISKEEWYHLLATNLEIDPKTTSMKDLLRNESYQAVQDHYAKIQDMLRRLSTTANHQYFRDFFPNISAESPHYVFGKLSENKVSLADVQKLIDSVAISPVTTAHPTNPNSVKYTKLAMELAEAFSNFDPEKQDESRAKIDLVLKKLAQVKIVDVKKKQSQELQVVNGVQGQVPFYYQSGGDEICENETHEGLLYLGAVYDSMSKVYALLEEAKNQSQYPNLQLPQNLVRIGVWMAGDGDGNPNSDAESLSYNIKSFIEEISHRYKRDIESVATEGFQGIDKERKIKLLEAIAKKDIEQFQILLASSIQNNQEKIKRLHGQGPESQARKQIIKKLNNLLMASNTFGFYFAKIDIRHESSDIMKAVVAMIEAADPSFKGQELTAEVLTAALQNKELIAKIQKLTDQDFAEVKNAELAKRIFNRLKIVGENPQMVDRLIIAECKEMKHIYAALFLLKTSGNQIEEGARIGIVPLAEDLQALENLSRNIATSLDNPAFAKLTRNLRKVYFMIAKSDTVRRDGVGAQKWQEDAVINSIVTIIENLPKIFGKTKFEELTPAEIEELKDIEIIPYNGGGQALQRGGGRLTELPVVYANYALEAKQILMKKFAGNEIAEGVIANAKISSPIFTVQGHHNYIMYSPASDVGSDNIESFISQGLYAAAKISDLVTNVKHDEGKIKFASDADKSLTHEHIREARHRAYTRGVEKYGEMKNPRSDINQLFIKNPAIALVNMGNQSSRPAKKPQLSADSHFLDPRAIGVEKFCALTETRLVSWYGMKELLADLAEVRGDKIDELAKTSGLTRLNTIYNCDKSFRDNIRSAAITLYMTNFRNAGEILCDRPEDARVLDYIEAEAAQTKRLIYQTITGKEPSAAEGERFFDKLMADYIPIDKEQIDLREKGNQFANFLKKETIQYLKQHEATITDEQAFRTVYSAFDSTANTPSLLMSFTRDIEARKTDRLDQIKLLKTMDCCAMRTHPGTPKGEPLSQSQLSRT